MAQSGENVVWFEGMTLDPHHMQQWDRHQRTDLQARLRAINPHGWGFTAVAVDLGRLTNGELALSEASGLLPDGLPFEMPARDALPAARAVSGHFEAAREHLPVYLALPVAQSGSASVTLQHASGGAADFNGRDGTRFSAATVGVPDANTGTDERDIEVARPNFQLRFDDEPMGAFTTLQVADLKRSSGGFALREDFVPPCLRLDASDWLSSATRQLLELLVSKSDAFTERREHAMAQRELSATDVNALGLLAAFNTHVPLLSDFLQNSGRHPEALFRVLLGLAGRLTAHVGEASVAPRHLPAYRHERLSECFTQLTEVLHAMLHEATPQANYTRVALHEKRKRLFVAEVDPRQIERAQFFLIVRSDPMDEETLVRAVSEQLRVASAQTIEAVLSSYTRALALQHTARLPVGLPVDPQAHYFRLKKRGPFWEAIEETGELAVFAPSDLGALSLELVTVENP